MSSSPTEPQQITSVETCEKNVGFAEYSHMLVCWLIPGMPLSRQVQRGSVVAPVGHVPSRPQQLTGGSPLGKHSHMRTECIQGFKNPSTFHLQKNEL